MKRLDMLTLEEIKELNCEIVAEDKLLSELWENEFVERLENLGSSGYKTGCTWYDVQLVDGSRIDIYTE